MILAIDQGTTGTTVLLVDEGGEIRGRAHREITQHYPAPGRVEHDAEEIWQSVLTCVAEVLSDPSVRPALTAIGITNQRETVVLWERAGLRPRGPAIVWQDRRTSEACDRLRDAGHEGRVRAITGLRLDPYFSATKVAWQLEHDPRLRSDGEAGRVAFGTVDSWLVARLTAGRVHATDPGNASRTLLCSLAGGWDPGLLDLFRVPAAMLPEIRPSSGDFGRTDPDAFLGLDLPIGGVAGDQQAALFGQGCHAAGLSKCTYGTGAFVLVHTGRRPMPSESLLTTIAWDLGSGPEYALEGSVFMCGASLQWLRDELGVIGSAVEAGPICEALNDNGGVYLVPAFAGLGAPRWDPYARGLIAGLTRGSDRRHLVRAAVEAMAYQVADLVLAVETESGLAVPELRVDGGASQMDFLLQFQADLLQRRVRRARSPETTALGAAFLAGLATGTWRDPAEVASAAGPGREFSPLRTPAEVEPLVAGWRRAEALAGGWARPDAPADTKPTPEASNG
ncbi:MAG: FGGY family carbohydrate kinase [Candidatus Dormibacteria bacterium]